jgi:hypothetical protein
MCGLGLHDARRRRRSIRNSLRLQQRCGRRGGHAEARDHAWHDVGVFPPLQPQGRGAGTESLQVAAKRHDGAGQLRPVLMPRSDAAATAHPGDRVAERATDRGSLGLRRARRQVRPSVRPPEPRPAGTKEANGVPRLQEEADQKGEPTDQSLRRVRGRIRTGPICIGEVGFGRNGERGSHRLGYYNRAARRVKLFFLVR